MMSILAMDIENLAMIVGIILVTWMMLRSYYRKTSKPRQTSKEKARDMVSQVSEQHAMKDDFQELLVDLQELSREISAQIETKFAKLEESIRCADQRIDKLQKLSGASLNIDALVDDSHVPAPEDHKVSAAEQDPLRRRIYELSDSGCDAVQIAQDMQHSVGEIELILSLRNASRT